MSQELTPQQQECFERFSKLKVGALFMKMGTGKTRAALELVKYNKPNYLLYITPFSTIENIKKEFEKWGCDYKYEIVGYESIAMSDRRYLELLDTLKSQDHNFIICDESIFIKNGKTKRFNRCCELRKYCEWALILNGTPIVKNERDIFNQMQFLSPYILNMGYYEFLHKFFIEHLKRRNNQEFRYFTFYEPNRPAFLKLIKPYTFFCDLEFSKEEKQDHVWIEDDRELEEYDLIKESALDRYESFDCDSLIDLFGTLHHIAALSKVKNNELIKYISNKKLIVYCCYKDEVEYISSHCDCYVITGSTTKKERKRIMEEFEKCENKPLLLTFGVGSYSLNLQFCNEIVYSSLTWNYGNLEQSEYRIKRLNQENDIKYKYFFLNVGINRMVLSNIYSKDGLATVVAKELQNNDIKEILKKL